jgi:hypothetical protein
MSNYGTFCGHNFCGHNLYLGVGLAGVEVGLADGDEVEPVLAHVRVEQHDL